MNINNLIKLTNKFNKMINSLIYQFNKYKLDEYSAIFLAKTTKRFMSFTEITLLKILFSVLGKFNNIKYKFDKEIYDTNEIINGTFNQINKSLNTILYHKVDKNKQKEVENIQSYLLFTKKVINHLFNMVISVIKFQTELINEKDFREKYREFKVNLENDKKEFEQIIKDKYPLN